MFWCLISALLPLPAWGDGLFSLDSVFWHIALEVRSDLSLIGSTSPLMLMVNGISPIYQFSLGESTSLTHYVKQIISWLLTLHLALWLDMCHSCRRWRIIFKRGQFALNLLFQCHHQYPEGPSLSLLGSLFWSHCQWLALLWTTASTWPKPVTVPQVPS